MASYKFFVPIPKKDREYHKSAEGKVLAESGKHDNPRWISVGYVSKQTPLGQGTGLGFERSELRPAKRHEILAALEQDHPHGKNFRPSCRKAMDADFHLVMSQAISNWTTDEPSKHGSIIGVSRKQLEDARDEALREHRKMLANWDTITAAQIADIKAYLGYEELSKLQRFINWIWISRSFNNKSKIVMLILILAVFFSVLLFAP